MNGFPYITALTLAPLLGGIIVLGIPRAQPRLARSLAILCSVVALALALLVWLAFDPAIGTLQLVERYDWVARLGIHYFVGVDGLSLLMIVLTALVVPMAMIASWRISQNVPLYFGLVLLLQAGLFGTFTALNFFHWFLFWELSLIPAFFLVRLWGGAARAEAATRFFVYTMVGSVALLLAFLAVFAATGVFDFIELAKWGRDGRIAAALDGALGWYDLTVKRLALVVFAGALLGFAVKVPMMPFHSWLPPAYTQAHTGTAMLLTGLMSKMGVYAFLRILLPIFQQEMRWVAPALLWLAVLTIVVSAGAALAQRDLRSILAYSSINHLGYCLLTVFAVAHAHAPSAAVAVERATALNGAMLQMFNHGLTAATLFWFVGVLEQRSGGRRLVEDFGGLRMVAPVLTGLMGISLFSSLGLPGLNGFISEFLIFKGAFALAPLATAFSLLGLLLTAVFILKVLQGVFWGPLNPEHAKFRDLSAGEKIMFSVPVALMLVLGVYPQLLLRVTNSTVLNLVEQIHW